MGGVVEELIPGQIRIIGLTEKLGQARLSADERDLVAEQLQVLVQTLQRLELLLEGTRVRGNLPADPAAVTAPVIVPNTLRRYLDLEPLVPEADHHGGDSRAGS
jgi:hypothetical protein